MAETHERDAFRGMMGIAAKAGKIRSGEFASEKSVKSGKAKLCLVSGDASERTRKHFSDMCSYRGVPLKELETGMTELGQMIGRGPRSSAVIEDQGLADRIIGIIDGGKASDKRE